MAKPLTFILLDESVTTYGIRILVDGVDLSQFERNSVMLFIHNDCELPIGRWVNVRKENNCILADAEFDEGDEFAIKIKGKVERGFIKMASAGLIPNLVSDDASYKLKDQTGPTVVKSRMREASIVPIGANHNALRLYDSKDNHLDLTDKEILLQFSDQQTSNKQFNKRVEMTKITSLLNLQDAASEDAIVVAVQAIINQKDIFKNENETLKLKVQTLEQAEKTKKSAEAVKLIDDAIKDARIDAKLKESYLKFFDSDFDTAKQTLAGITAPGHVADKTKEGKQSGNPSLADMNFKDIVAKDLLKDLKKDPELYKEKFHEAYGKYPA